MGKAREGRRVDVQGELIEEGVGVRTERSRISRAACVKACSQKQHPGL